MLIRNKILVVVGVTIFVLLSTLLAIRFLSGEDGWLCVDNQWVRHGNPRESAPENGCGAVKKEQTTEEGEIQTPTVLGPVSWNNKSTAPVTLLFNTNALSKPYLTSPAKITGSMPSSWYFEASAFLILKDGNGKILYEGPATAQEEWTKPGLIPFEATLAFDTPVTATGFLILQNDNPSGMSENQMSETYQVIFWPTIKVYFNDRVAVPNMLDCSKVYSAERYIRHTSAVARAALEELLKGPDTSSKFERNFITNINPGVVIQKLTIEDGIAKVDFNKKLETGGSCAVAAIRSQIENTLKQFPTVKSVVISIDGRIEDILQP